VDHLVKSLANVKQTAVAMQVATALEVDERFDLALASDNPFVQFACVYQTLSGRFAVRALATNAEQLLAKVLVKIGSDAARWTGWMRVFNAYPQRYPGLQDALGCALVDMPDAAREAYVASIMLLPTPVDIPAPGRECVATCLRTFHTKATPAQRVALWTMAYERWRKWRFNESDRNQHLFKINRSPLDYAIIGYGCECLNDAEREREMASITAELQTLEDRWHGSITDIITEWNRLLSMFQPFGQAHCAMNSGQDWLTQNIEFWPFDYSKEEYLLARFGVAPKKRCTQP
jgi:hypothetical protein